MGTNDNKIRTKPRSEPILELVGKLAMLVMTVHHNKNHDKTRMYSLFLPAQKFIILQFDMNSLFMFISMMFLILSGGITLSFVELISV